MTARQFKLTGPSTYSSRLTGTNALKRGETILLDAGDTADHIAGLTQVIGDREETMFTEVGPGLSKPTYDLTTAPVTVKPRAEEHAPQTEQETAPAAKANITQRARRAAVSP